MESGLDQHSFQIALDIVAIPVAFLFGHVAFSLLHSKEIAYLKKEKERLRRSIAELDEELERIGPAPPELNGHAVRVWVNGSGPPPPQ